VAGVDGFFAADADVFFDFFPVVEDLAERD
jgi:hypothetical protein